MCNRLNEVLTSAHAVVASLDLDTLTGSQVAKVFEAGAELERLGASLKVLVSPRIAQSETWARAGHRSPEEWMARTSGISVGQAKTTVETGRRLEELPATATAVKSGVLSFAQAAAVAEAAAADPEAESHLLETAATESLKVLQDKARRVVLDSRGSLEERYERQRQLRMFSSYTDEEGMTAGRFRLTPEVGAAVISKIRREADRLYRQAYNEGRRESSENYAADAFAALVTGDRLIRGRSNSKAAEVTVLVSRESLLRGEVDQEAGELCEVPGFGAIPVSRAREMMADAFLKGVIYDGTVVSHVEHFGRHRPAAVDTALLVQAVLTKGQVVCEVEQCDRTTGIHWDHKLPFALGGPTSSRNVRPLCGYDNQLKERGLVVERDGKWIRLGAASDPPDDG